VKGHRSESVCVDNKRRKSVSRSPLVTVPGGVCYVTLSECFSLRYGTRTVCIRWSRHNDVDINKTRPILSNSTDYSQFSLGARVTPNVYSPRVL